MNNADDGQDDRQDETRYPSIATTIGSESFLNNVTVSSDVFEPPNDEFQKRIIYPFKYKINLRNVGKVCEPQSRKAQAFSLFSTICLFTTIVIICLDSLPTFFMIKDVNIHIWLPFDILIVIVFTIEYAGSFFAAPNKWKFAISLSNLLNLISIIPFYIQIFSPFSADATLRFTRILRITRIIKSLQRIGRFSDGFMIATNIFLLSSIRILINLIYILIILTISAISIYYVERGDFDYTTDLWYRTLPDGTREKSPFQSVFHSLYWSITTLTTTGYGDIVPITAIGQCIAALTSLSGILVIAVTSSIIGINSDLEWSKYQQHKTKIDFSEMWKAIDDKNVDNLSRSEQIKKEEILKFQNGILRDLIEEIQKNFNNVAGFGIMTYLNKYNELEFEHSLTNEKLNKLEFEMKKYETILGNIDDYHHHEHIDKKQKNKLF
ncbi:potassium voltage-gated channel subfamily A member 7-like [Rhizophagus clarus]|uniref:Potassium voltage-gated channel subfamily A member 7-like n=1 Tax=Rhizophagus clarus TaxID=94130 RepID=A0A8H3QKZ1_9GLOM|nr:potassium voltage-gated channel subfamily A member 7-like [Rhizophagus clarus]